MRRKTVRNPHSMILLSHQPAKFTGYMHCDIGYIMALVCHLVSRVHVFQEPCELIGRSLGSSHWGCFVKKKVFLKFRKFHMKIPVL